MITFLFTLAISFFFASLVGLLIRIKYIYGPQKPCAAPSLLVLLGSGGHTGEMIGMLKNMSLDRFAVRSYVSNDNDPLSLTRAKDMESSRPSDSSVTVQYLTLSRARSVGQSWITSVFSSAFCFWQCIQILQTTKPSVILTNGPGSSVMLSYAALILRVSL